MVCNNFHTLISIVIYSCGSKPSTCKCNWNAWPYWGTCFQSLHIQDWVLEGNVCSAVYNDPVHSSPSRNASNSCMVCVLLCCVICLFICMSLSMIVNQFSVCGSLCSVEVLEQYLWCYHCTSIHLFASVLPCGHMIWIMWHCMTHALCLAWVRSILSLFQGISLLTIVIISAASYMLMWLELFSWNKKFSMSCYWPHFPCVLSRHLALDYHLCWAHNFVALLVVWLDMINCWFIQS